MDGVGLGPWPAHVGVVQLGIDEIKFNDAQKYGKKEAVSC